MYMDVDAGKDCEFENVKVDEDEVTDMVPVPTVKYNEPTTPKPEQSIDAIPDTSRN